MSLDNNWPNIALTSASTALFPIKILSSQVVCCGSPCGLGERLFLTWSSDPSSIKPSAEIKQACIYFLEILKRQNMAREWNTSKEKTYLDRAYFEVNTGNQASVGRRIMTALWSAVSQQAKFRWLLHCPFPLVGFPYYQSAWFRVKFWALVVHDSVTEARRNCS